MCWCCVWEYNTDESTEGECETNHVCIIEHQSMTDSSPYVFVMYLGGRVRSLESTAIDLLSVLQKVQSSSGVRLIAHPSEKEMCIFGWALGSTHPSEKRCTLGDRRIGSRHYVAANTFGWMQCSRRSLNGDDGGKVVGWAVDVMMAVGGGLLCNYCVPSGQISFGGTYFS